MKKALVVLGGAFALFASAAFAAVNINTADVDMLASLPGIGQVKAQSIVEYREANGAFGSKDDLTEVSGVGDATLDEIRDQIILDE